MRASAGRFLAACLFLSACVGGPTVEGVALDGTTWQAVRVAALEPLAGHEPTITFTSGGVSGFMGCNSFGAERVAIADGRIEVINPGMTASQCGPPNQGVMRTESDFFWALKTAQEIGFRDHLLVISGKTGELLFKPVAGVAGSLR